MNFSFIYGREKRNFCFLSLPYFFRLISDFYRRNKYAVTKNSLTTVFDVSSLANSYKVQLAVFKFPGKEMVTDLTMAEESSSDVTWNTQKLPVRNTNSTELYDISLVLNEWKHKGKNPDKLFITFNISNQMRKESLKQVLRTWGAMTKDGKWRKRDQCFSLHTPKPR